MPVRIALVGADETARAIIETFQSVDEARVVAVCAGGKSDIEYSMAETLSRRVKGKAFRDVKAMLRDETPDAICCTAAGRARRDIEKLALPSGCDVFLLPPFALSLAAAQTLSQIATQARSRLWISHHERFFASTEQARKVLSARGQAPNSCFGSWKLDQGAKSAAPLASSTRLIGLLRFFCGDIKSVFARSSSTLMTLNLEFANGLSGAFVISAHGENVLHFHSPHQNLEWRDLALTVRRGPETQRIEYSNDAFRNAQREELRLWVQSVQSGRRTLQKSNSQDSLQTLRVALALQQSAKTNKSVRIN